MRDEQREAFLVEGADRPGAFDYDMTQTYFVVGRDRYARRVGYFQTHEEHAAWQQARAWLEGAAVDVRIISTRTIDLSLPLGYAPRS